MCTSNLQPLTADNERKDSIPTESLDFKENTEAILYSSVNPDYSRNLMLNNSDVKEFEVNKKSHKDVLVKIFTKNQKLNLVQKYIVKKIEKRVDNKENFNWNVFQFWLYAGVLSLISIFSLILFYGFKVGFLWSILGGFFILIGIMIFYVTIINPTALR